MSQSADIEKSEKIIGCLAAMRANIIENDMISSYVPFVATVLMKEKEGAPDGKVEISNIIKRFTADYGFEIERAPMVSILSKCVRRGIITRSKHGYYTVIEDKCREVAISESEVSREGAKYQKVVTALCEFYKERYKVDDISKADVEESLLLFFYRHSVKTLRLGFGTNEQVENQSLKDISHQYIVSQFILEAKKENDEIFRLVQSLALAFLMSSCIAYTEDRDDRSQIDAYKNICVYVDTPWLLRIIGANDDEMQAAELELLKRIKKLNGKLFIFRHTYDEALHILQDCLFWIDNPECNVTYASNALRSFIRRKFQKEDVSEFVDTFDYKLKINGIEIDDSDYVNGKYYTSPIDENPIFQTIKNTYKPPETGHGGYVKNGTIENDAKSIAYILRKWGSKRSNTYRQAKYVFVTTNEGLAFAARKLPKEYNINNMNNVYPCITNVYLGTNIWLSAPVKTIETFSMKKLLSDCMTQIEPSEKLINAVQRSIDKYAKDESVSQERLYLLRTRAFSNDYIMDVTLGDENRFNDSICDELIENLENEIKQPLKDENDRLSSSLQTYRDKEKRIKTIVDGCDSKAERIVNFGKTSGWIILVITILTYIINASGFLGLSNRIVNSLSCTLFALTLIIEIVFKKFGGKLEKVLARLFRITNIELDRLQTMNIEDKANKRAV